MTPEQHAFAKQQIDGMEIGAEFHLSDLFGAVWMSFPVGDRLSMGKQFRRAVAEGHYPSVEDFDCETDNERIYKKKNA